jgi:hypothetical protein
MFSVSTSFSTKQRATGGHLLVEESEASPSWAYALQNSVRQNPAGSFTEKILIFLVAIA